jgi:hypothetical protein
MTPRQGLPRRGRPGRRSRGLAVAIVVAAIATIPAADPAVAAQPAPAVPFVPGSGSASSEVARVALRSSGTVVSIGVGTTRARFAGAQGNAEAAGLDLGLLDLASRAPVACGAAAGSALPPGSMPSPVKVSSGDGASAQRRASAGAGTPLEVMSQSGSARPDAAADADVGGVRLAIPGIVTATGGSAGSTATLTPGKERAANADSDLGSVSLAGGLVRLDGMRWNASHRTGTDPASAAGFTVAGIVVGGRSLPSSDAASIAQSLAAANAALAPIGLALTAPQVLRTDAATAVTPLRLSVSATPEVRRLLAAVLEGVQPMRTQLLALLDPFRVSKDCGMSNVVGFGYLLTDLALVVLGDGGGIDLDLGGATAGTQAVSYANPLASGYGLLPSIGGVIPGAAAPPPIGATRQAGAGTAEPLGRPAPLTGGQITTSNGPTMLGRGSPVAWVCRSTRAGSGCAGRAGALAGWLVLVLIVVLAAADRLRARRSAAKPRTEASS